MDQKFIKALQTNNLPDLKRFATIIGTGINIDIYDGLLAEEQIESITNSIYTSLVGVANYKVNRAFKKFVDNRTSKMPNELDISTLPKDFMAAIGELFLNPKISFESEFLNDQFELGNILFNPHTKCIVLQITSEFKAINVEGKKHKAKILAALKKEGYTYDYGRDGYLKA